MLFYATYSFPFSTQNGNNFRMDFRAARIIGVGKSGHRGRERTKTRGRIEHEIAISTK